LSTTHEEKVEKWQKEIDTAEDKDFWVALKQARIKAGQFDPKNTGAIEEVILLYQASVAAEDAKRQRRREDDSDNRDNKGLWLNGAAVGISLSAFIISIAALITE